MRKVRSGEKMLVHKFTLALKDTEAIGAIDTIRPEPPTGTIVAIAGDRQVSFSGFIASVSSDVIGYNAYAQAGPGSKVKVNTNLLSIAALNQYTISGLTNGVPYAFTFTAVDASGNESLDSATVLATPNNNVVDTTAPSPPSSPGVLLATAQELAVLIEGMGASSSNDVIGYNAYYAVSGGGTFKHNTSLLSAAQIASYLFNGLTGGVQHTFWFTAVDSSANESAASTTVLGTPLIVVSVTGLFDPIFDPIFD